MPTSKEASQTLRRELTSLADYLETAIRDQEAGRPLNSYDLAKRLQTVSESISNDQDAAKWLQVQLAPSIQFYQIGSPFVDARNRYFDCLNKYAESPLIRVFKQRWRNFGKPSLFDLTPHAYMDLLAWWDELFLGGDDETRRARAKLDQALHYANAAFNYDHFYGLALFQIASRADGSTGERYLAQHVVDGFAKEPEFLAILRSLDRCARELLDSVGTPKTIPDTQLTKLKAKALKLAQGKLKWGRRRIVELVCESNSPVALASLAVDPEIAWDSPYDGRWSRAQAGINKAMKEIGVWFRRLDSEIHLEALPTKTRRNTAKAKPKTVRKSKRSSSASKR